MAIPPRIQKIADRFNTWIGLYTVVAGAFTWVGAQLEALKPYGWPEAVVFGVLMAALLTLVAAAFMVAYRKIRPLPARDAVATAVKAAEAPAPPTGFRSESERSGPAPEKAGGDHAASTFEPKGLYVGWMQVVTANAEQERIIDITMRAFNATGQVLAIRTVEGAISCGICPEGGGTVESIGSLPPPRIKTEIFENDAVANFSEFVLVLEQRITTGFLAALGKMPDGFSVHLNFDSLGVYAEPTSMKDARIRLSLWNGVGLHYPAGLTASRIISASMAVREGDA